MQSAVAGRVIGSDEEVESLGSKVTFQRQGDDGNDADDNDDILGDNDIERILSRPAAPRRKLDLFDAPEFTQRLSNYQEATVGETVTFTGQYRAFPRPTVKWFKDEEEVNETTRHRIDLSSESEGTVRLIISDVIKRDEGAYKCKVENQEGVASTTGYLSVSGKSSDKTHSLQSRKLAQDRVSTPPYLRPIAEQKSMEEREEKEYQCLPPSPLQEFMDRIRHGAKSMHGPIVYADLEMLYSDEDVSDVIDDDAVEVFDEEQNSETPSSSPVEDIRLEDVLPRHPDEDEFTTKSDPSIQVVDEFVSPSVDLKAAPTCMSAPTSVEDTAHDSNNQNVGPLKCTMDGSGTLRSRRLQLLSLQRSAAVETADPEISSTVENHQHRSATVQIGPGRQRTPENDATPNEDSVHALGPQLEASRTFYQRSSSEVQEDSAQSSGNFADLFFRWLDSPWMQFFIGFAMSATVVSLACDIPPTFVVTAVILFSILSFQALERNHESG